eukprot:TRINITY_DN56037_c0_g1_i1.p1 TRINITY_DN56037_c0_g1~~TRINITY_DN56037_c0_g1_i1.p1  ORF type:complete len:312 (+),score=57.13 TRINITY_DN56037_c0_g1_i1:127-1062(+)
MSLLEGYRGSPATPFNLGWNERIELEQAFKLRDDRIREYENQQSERGSSVRSRKGPKPVAADVQCFLDFIAPPKQPPRLHRRLPQGSLHMGIKRAQSAPGLGSYLRGAFSAPAPGTGLLGKPNHFVPGKNEELGPAPPKQVRGEYPADYLYAQGAPFGVMLWDQSISSRDPRKPHANSWRRSAADLNNVFLGTGAAGGKGGQEEGGLSAAATLLKTWQPSSPTEACAATACNGRAATAAPPSSAASSRRRSGCRPQTTTATEARHEPIVDNVLGSSSYFLSLREFNRGGWASGDNNLTKPDGGRVSHYWGC